ncbi:MAG: hypothetical protein ACK47B_04870 [Armatimonadota bacterium]
MSETVEFACPQCGAAARVGQVQGDRCPGCGFEFKWFSAAEARTAQDYHAVLTRRTHLLELPEGEGFIVAHE